MNDVYQGVSARVAILARGRGFIGPSSTDLAVDVSTDLAIDAETDLAVRLWNVWAGRSARIDVVVTGPPSSRGGPA